MNQEAFMSGMNRLLALKVESRLSTEKLVQVYCIELAEAITPEAWLHAVTLAMQTEAVLPAPSWFLAIAKQHSELERKDSESGDRLEEKTSRESTFSPPVALGNIRKLQALIKTAGNFDF